MPRLWQPLSGKTLGPENQNQHHENIEKDQLVIKIEDNGKGMKEEELEMSLNPFFTTKKEKRIGLGLSLFHDAVRMAGGNLEITTREEWGTKIRAAFQYSHIDRKPLGNIKKTLETLIIGNPDVDFLYRYRKGEDKISFDTRKLRSSNEGNSSFSSTMIKRIREVFENKEK